MFDEEVLDQQLREHPNETIRRLKDLGVWGDADRLLRKVKQSIHRRYRGEGGPLTLARRVELAKAGWDAVQAEWPPPKGTAPLESLIEYVQTFQGSRGNRRLELPTLSVEAERRFNEIGEIENLTDEKIWVYHNIENAAVTAFECPSRGAWSLLAYAREDKDRFYRQHLKTATAEVAKRNARTSGESPEPSKQEKYCRAELQRMLEEARDHVVAQAEESLKGRCPHCQAIINLRELVPRKA